MKACRKCGETKSLALFPKRNKGNPGILDCRACCNAANNARYKAKYAAKRRTNYDKAARRERTITDYGITLEEYEQMIQSQNSCCKICERSEKLFIDHCHTTGAVRGLLCNQCNVALGMVRDNPATLSRMKEYLNGLQ